MKFVAHFLFCLLLLNGSSVQAQLILEKSVSPRQAELYVRSIPLDERNAYVRNHGAPYVYEEGAVSEVIGLRPKDVWTKVHFTLIGESIT